MDKYRDILGVSSEDGTLIAGLFKLEIFDEPGIENMYRTCMSFRNGDDGEWVVHVNDFKPRSGIIELAYMMCLLEGIEYFEGVIFGKDGTKEFARDENGDKVTAYTGTFTSEVGMGDYRLVVFKDTPQWSLTFDIEIEEEKGEVENGE